MNHPREQLFNSADTDMPQTQDCEDLISIGFAILIGCILMLIDPDRAFEWLAKQEEVQVDEFLTGTLIQVGAYPFGVSLSGC